MPTFAVYAYVTISTSKLIEAESEQEAREKAGRLNAPSLCHECSGAGGDYDDTWVLNGFDEPDPDNIMHVEKVENPASEVAS